MNDTLFREAAASMSIAIVAGLISTAIVTYVNDKVTRKDEDMPSLNFYKSLY